MGLTKTTPLHIVIIVQIDDRQVGLIGDRVLDIVPEEEAADAELGSWIGERIAARRQAREARDFVEADRIRTELSERGVVIEDSGGETRWKLG